MHMDNVQKETHVVSVMTEGPPESSLALGVVTSETRLQQAAGTVPWIGVDSQEGW